jgi:hypothetical protein
LIENEFKTFEPDLDYFILSKRSKCTDFISSAFFISRSFIISPKLLSLLLKFNLPPHVSYKIKIEYGKDNFIDYYILYFIDIGLEEINFSKSNFIIEESFSHKTVNDVKITSLEDYLKLKEKIRINFENGKSKRCSIITSKLCLKKQPLFDIFRVNPMINGSIFLNEKLKNELLTNYISGIELEEIDYLLFESTFLNKG